MPPVACSSHCALPRWVRHGLTWGQCSRTCWCSSRWMTASFSFWMPPEIARGLIMSRGEATPRGSGRIMKGLDHHQTLAVGVRLMSSDTAPADSADTFRQSGMMEEVKGNRVHPLENASLPATVQSLAASMRPALEEMAGPSRFSVLVLPVMDKDGRVPPSVEGRHRGDARGRQLSCAIARRWVPCRRRPPSHLGDGTDPPPHLCPIRARGAPPPLCHHACGHREAVTATCSCCA